MMFHVSIGAGGISRRSYTPPHVHLISCTKALLDLLRQTMSQLGTTSSQILDALLVGINAAATVCFEPSSPRADDDLVLLGIGDGMLNYWELRQLQQGHLIPPDLLIVIPVNARYARSRACVFAFFFCCPANYLFCIFPNA